MIEFKLPNFRVKVSEVTRDKTGQMVVTPKKDSRWRYCYAEDQEKAIVLIGQNNQIHIYKETIEVCDFTQEWQDHVGDAKTDVLNAIKSNKDPNFPSKWSKLKEHLIDMFHGKCGYCEARFTPTSFGDVEHYRPKGRVSEDKSHKGYYWLAYTPTNYLPACQLCNEPAKRDHFPIEGTRACSEADNLEHEKPFLLNPYFDRYEEHLEFVPSIYEAPPGTPPKMSGDVTGKTEKGNYSISIMEIHRDPIRDERLQRMMMALQSAQIALSRLTLERNYDRFKQSLQKLLSEDQPFRTAVYYELREYFTQIEWWSIVKPIFIESGFQID